MLALDFKYTLADNDLPKVSRSCELAASTSNIRCSTTPLSHFPPDSRPVSSLEARGCAISSKEALRGLLARRDYRKRKHGFGLPFGAWLAGVSAAAANRAGQSSLT